MEPAELRTGLQAAGVGGEGGPGAAALDAIMKRCDVSGDGRAPAQPPSPQSPVFRASRLCRFWHS